MRLPIWAAALCASATLSAAEPGAAPAPGGGREIVFIDAGIGGWPDLAAEVPAADEVVRIGPGEDGLGVIATTLAGRSGVPAIHVLSHGDPGRLGLGGAWLDRSALAGRAGQLAGIGRALRPGGDVLLYGCRVGAGEAGARFVQALADATGAHVAASDDLTGAAARGGNWALEVRCGDVRARGLEFPGYAGLLPNGTLTFTSDAGAPWSGGVATDGQGGSGDLPGIAIQVLDISDTAGTNLGVAMEWHNAADLANSHGFTGLTTFNPPDPLNGWKGMQVKSSDGTDFKISQFQFYDWDWTGGTVDVIGFRDGAAVAATSFTANNGDAIVTVSLDATFADVDDVRLTFHAGSGFPSINGIVIADAVPPLSPPTLAATGNNPTFTEGGAAVDLYSAVTAATNDVGQTFAGVTVTVTSVGNGASEALVIGGTTVPLTAGSGTVTGVGSYAVSVAGATATVTLSAMARSDAQMGALVDGITYANSSHDPGSASRVVTITAIADSGASSNTATISRVSTVAVVPVNDAPTLSATGGTPTYTENGAAVDLFSGVSVSTVESGQAVTALTLTVTGLSDGASEVLRADGSDIALTNGNSLTTATNSLSAAVSITAGTATVTLAKSAGVSAATAATVVDGFSYRDTSELPGTTARVVTLTSVRDNGGTANGGIDTTALSIAATVTVASVNDAPTITAPGSIAVTEDVASALTGLSFADVDANGGSETVTLGVGSGTLAATSGSGVTASGSGSASLTLVGTLANLNAFIAASQVTFTTAANATGSVTLAVGIDDGGNTGTDPGSSGTSSSEGASTTVTLSVAAVNDAPVATVPATLTATEDTATALTGISFADVDAGSASVTATLAVGAGTLAATSGGGVTASGSGSATLTLGGSTANLNTFIAGSNVTFTAASNATADVTLTTTINDNGNTGAGGAQTGGGTTTIHVTAVNDAPTITAPGSIAVTEDAASALTGLSFADVDANGGSETVTLGVGSGTLAATSGSGVAVSGSGTASLTLAGTLANLNAFIAASQVTFTTAADATGNVTLAVGIDDGGNTGVDPGLTGTPSSEAASTTVTLLVTAVNDAPVATVPATLSAAEDTATAVTGISFADVDAGSASVTATLAVGSGTLAATSGGGVTASGSGSATLTLGGSIANLNAFIAGSNVTFTTAGNATADVTLTTTIDDDGNTGSGGALTGGGTTTIQVTAVNDAPTITAPGSIAVTEDVASALTGLSFADVDANGGSETVTLAVGSGALVAASGSGVAVSGSGTGGLTLVGTLANLNAFIAASQVTFTTAANAAGNVTLAVGIDDGGNTGTDPGLTGTSSSEAASTTVTLAVTAVNDPPVNTVPGPQSVPQDGTLVFSAGNGNALSVADVDAGANPVEVTLTATHGTLTLSGTTGLAFLVGSGSGDATMTFTGTLAATNAALAGLAFAPTGGYHGAAALQITANDQGATGVGGAGTDTDSVAITVAPLNPVVVSVDATTADGLYGIGATVAVTVRFSAAVLVDTTGGTPTLLLETGTVDRAAAYVSGAGSDTLAFAYVVQAGDHSGDLDYASTAALALNGAAIADGAANQALLTLPAVGGGASLGGQRAIVVDGIAPVVTAVAVPAAGTARAGQDLDFTVAFSEAVVVGTGGGTPRLVIDVGGAARAATYRSGSGSASLLFRATVLAGDADGDGIALPAAIDANGGTLRDAAGNAADPALHNAGGTAGVLVDAVAPAVLALSRADASPTDRTTLAYTLTFSEGVVGVDAGDLAVVPTGTASGSVLAVTAVDAATYTVQVGGVAGVGTLRVDLRASGTGIADAAGNALVGGLAGEVYAVDDAAPAVSAVGVPPAGTYTAGQVLDFTVTFTEPVLVDTSGGSPRLAIDVGGASRFADYAAGSGSAVLSFQATVQAADAAPGGIVLAGAIDLHGAVLRDAAGNAALLALAAVPSTSGIVVSTPPGGGRSWWAARKAQNYDGRCGLGSGVAALAACALLLVLRWRRLR